LRLPRSFPGCGCGPPTARRGSGIQPGRRRGDRERRVHCDAFFAREGQIRQGDLGFTDGLHAVCAIQRFTLIDREHPVAPGQKHRLAPPLYQLPGIPVWHRRRGWCRSRPGRCRDPGRWRPPRTRREERCAECSKLRTLRQCERNRAATGPARVGRKCVRSPCRALHSGGIKNDKPQRPGKDRKQARLSHPCTHVPQAFY